VDVRRGADAHVSRDATLPGSGADPVHASRATHKSVDLRVAPDNGCVVAVGDLQKVVGRNLRRFRESKGMSQEQLALLLGYHRTYAGGLERGERNLSLRSVEVLAERMSVDVMELLDDGAQTSEG
jgi:ribosome-binding protein aMBF1 (putative translation factor)